MGCSNSKVFWTQQFGALFCNADLIPLNSMSLEEQFNSLTRFTFLIFLLLLLFNTIVALIFLLVSLTLIISLYYIKKRKMNQQENFSLPRYLPTPSQSPIDSTNLSVSKPISVEQGKALAEMGWGGNHITLQTPQQYRFCQDTVQPSFGPQYKSINQKLAGPPNPKTKIPPVVIAPAQALDYWRANPLVIHSHINSESQEDIYQMGYVVSTCCGNIPNGTKFEPTNPPPPSHPSPSYQLSDSQIPQTSYQSAGSFQPLQSYQSEEPYKSSKEIKENFAFFDTKPHPLATDEHQSPQYQHSSQSCGPSVYPNMYDFPYVKDSIEAPYVQPATSGDVMTSCGYNPEQIKTNLPTNYGTGLCEQANSFSDYNKNLFTQTIQPNVYTTNQIIEPINSNIGISWTQQFPPTTCQLDKNDDTFYTQHDPRLIKPQLVQPNDEVINEVNNSNVYDPRFYGYGTSYRSYIDKMTGQPRFMYDDIKAIRMPNYIVRSNIDFTPYADSYGPIPKGNEFGNKYNSDIRALANDTFMRDTIGQRNDLTERMMRKINAEHWQRRMSPHGPRMAMANIGC